MGIQENGLLSFANLHPPSCLYVLQPTNFDEAEGDKAEEADVEKLD